MEEAEGEALAPASNPPGINWSWLEAIPPHSDKSYSLKSLCQQKGLDDTGLAKKLVARLIEAGGPTLESLREMCKAAGLGTSGGRKQLADRLWNQQHAFLDAAKRGDFEEVRKLLEVHSHLVNVQPGGRWSALHQFAQKGNKDAVKYLLEKGAGTCVVNKDDDTPREVTPLDAPAVRSMLQDKEDQTLSAISKVIKSHVHRLDDHCTTKNSIRMDLQGRGYVEGTHYRRQWFKDQIERERTDSLDILNFKQAAKEADIQLDGSETKTKIIEKLAGKLAKQVEEEEAKSAVPWNLHGFKKRSLEKLGAARLKVLCWERDLDVKKKAHSTTCIQRLMEWKKKPTSEPTITEESIAAEEPMEEESDAGDGGEKDDDDDGEDAIPLPVELRDNPGLVRVQKSKLQTYGKEILRKLCSDRRIPGIRKNCSNVQKMADALARWRGTPKAKQWVEEQASDDDDEEEEEDKPMDIPEDDGFAVSDKVYVEGESRRGQIMEIGSGDRKGQVRVRIPFRPSQWVDVEKVRYETFAAKQKGNREADCEPSAKKKKMAPEQSASSSSAFGAKTKEADYYSALNNENREKIMKIVEDYLKMQRLEEENKQLQEDVGEAKKLLRKAGAQIMKLEAQLSDGSGLLTKEQSKQLKKLEDDKRIPTGYMEIKAYRKALEERGLLEKAAGAAHEGQHVFHIIAAANGGPDHTDNYLFALGGTFNIAVGAHLDHFNCFLAGKAKAMKAVAIAMQAAKDPALHRWIRTPTGKDFRIYTEGKHKGKTGEDLFNDGQKVFRAIRDEERNRMKAKGSSST